MISICHSYLRKVLNAYGNWVTALSGRNMDIQKTNRMHVLMSTSLLIFINIAAKASSFKHLRINLLNISSVLSTAIWSPFTFQRTAYAFFRSCEVPRIAFKPILEVTVSTRPPAGRHNFNKDRIGLLAHWEIYKSIWASFYLLWCFIQTECTHFLEVQSRQ